MDPASTAVLAPPSRLTSMLWGGAFALPIAALAGTALPVATLLAALLTAAGFLFACSNHPRRLAGLCALPALLAALAAPAPDVRWPRPGPVAIAGEVTNVTRAPLTGSTFVALNTAGGPVRLSLDGEITALPGDRIALFGRVGEPATPDQPPTLHGLTGTMQVTPGGPSLGRLFAAARRTLEARLLALAPGELGAMLAMLVLGRDTRTSPELTAAHQATGLSHLLAVSGAHAAMLAMLLGLGGTRGRRLGIGPWRTSLILVVLFVYAGITGCEPPVLRAVLTFGLGALATQLGRPLPIANGLLLPATVTCLVQPQALLGPSFLLSYAAVLGLALAPHPRAPSALDRWLWAPLRASWWATLLTAPLTLHFFGQLAPWTILLTPLLAPLVAAMLLGGLATAVIACFAPALGDLLAGPLVSIAQLYAWTVRAADALPGTPVHALVTPPMWLVACSATAAFAAIALRPDRSGVRNAILWLIAPHFAPLGGEPQPSFCLCAVGHGQAAAATLADGAQVVVDCGSLQVPKFAARAVLAELQRRRIDLLVVTHADQDHHNAVAMLLRSVPIAHAVLPEALAASPLADDLREHGTDVFVLAPGASTEAFGSVAIAAPGLPDGASDNDQSLWVRLTIGASTVLLTGDAQEVGTSAALAGGIVVPSDVLVLPHHGRPNALAPQLLAAARPRACFASATTADGDTALGPLVRRCGADLWVTGRHGTLTLHADPPTVSTGRPAMPLPP